MKIIINEDGLVMYDNGYIAIDTRIWTTQAKLAKKLGKSGNCINNRVRRGMAAGTIKTFYIDELGVRLIPNVRKINELVTNPKKTTKK